MLYFEVFKTSNLNNHKGQELNTLLSKEIKQRLIDKGFKETKDSFKISLSKVI